MHPLLTGRLRTFLYLVLWAGVIVTLAILLDLLRPRPLAQALLFVGPPTVVYASICLSAWWVCRAHPLDTTPPGRLLRDLLGTALVATGMWVAVAALWGGLMRGTLPSAPAGGPALRDFELLGGAE